MKKTGIIILLSMFVYVFSGCVAKEDYLKEVAEKETFEKKLTDAQKEMADYKAAKEAEIKGLLKQKEEEISSLDAQKSKEFADEVEKIKMTKEQELQALKEIQQKELAEAKRTFETLVSNLQGEIDSKQVTIKKLGQKIQVELSNSILFPSGSAILRQEGEDVLFKVTGTLTQAQEAYEILVEGHTDDVKISAALKKRYPSNWELSAARAAGVVRVLVEKGVHPEHIIASGRSEFSPVAGNDTVEGRSQNRRIEIILIPRKIIKG